MSGCDTNLVTRDDLYKAKRQTQFIADVGTGRDASGNPVDTVTNPDTGVVAATLPYIEQLFEQKLAQLGYNLVGTYASNPVLQNVGDVCQYSDGTFWAAKNPPYTVDSATYPTPADDSANLKMVSEVIYPALGFLPWQSGQQCEVNEVRRFVSTTNEGYIDVKNVSGAPVTMGVEPDFVNFVFNKVVADTSVQVDVQQLPTVLNNLKNTVVSAGLTLNISPGQFTLSSPIEITIIGGENVKVIGAPMTELGVATQVSLGDYVDNYQEVVISGVTASVGDWLDISEVSVPALGFGYFIAGCWQVTTSTPTSATIKVRTYKQPPSISVLSVKVSKYNTVFKFTDCDGFVSKGKVGLIDNIMIVGNADAYWSSSDIPGTEKGTHGVYAGGLSIINNDWNPDSVGNASVSLGYNVGVNGFDQQGVCEDQSGAIFAYGVSSCNNRRRGFYAAGGKIRNKFAVANGNYLDGMIADYGNSVECSIAICAGNRLAGASSTNGSSLSSPHTKYELNGIGGEAKDGGTLICSESTFNGNTARDVYCEFGTVINTNSKMETLGENVRAFFGKVDLTNTQFNQSSVTHINSQQSELLISGSDASKFTTQDSIIREGNNFETYRCSPDLHVLNDFRVFSGGVNYFRPIVSSLGDLGFNLNGQTVLTAKADKTSLYANDSGTSLGRSSNPYNTVYATNGSIQPCDERLKTEGEPIPDGVFRAWGEVRQSIIMWMWKPEFKKSDRYHFGPYAQDIVAAFERHGEDPYKYALNCYDKWANEYDDDGNLTIHQGDRLSIRKDELFMLEIAYQVWKENGGS